MTEKTFNESVPYATVIVEVKKSNFSSSYETCKTVTADANGNFAFTFEAKKKETGIA